MNSGDYAIQALLDKLHDTVRINVQSANAMSDICDEITAVLRDRVVFTSDFKLDDRPGNGPNLRLVADNE